MSESKYQQTQKYLKLVDSIPGNLEVREMSMVFAKNKGLRRYLWEYVANDANDVDRRAKACWMLARSGDGTDISLFLRLLDSDREEIFWEAAKAVSLLGTRETYKDLVTSYSNASFQRRMATLYLIGFSGNRRWAAFLQGVLRNKEEGTQLRCYAAEALGHLRSKAAEGSLLLALQEKSKDLRFWAIFALGCINSRKSLKRLNELALCDQRRVKGFGTVSQEARQAIAIIRDNLRGIGVTSCNVAAC